jgi:class 3 adenylate cyclase
MLLMLLAPVWLVGFALELRVLATDRVAAWPGVVVKAPASPDEYPVVVAFQDWERDASGLMLGDRLVRIGDSDLRGVGPFGFAARARAEAFGDLEAPVGYIHNGESHEATLRLRPHPVGWSLPLIAFVWAFTGVLVLWRAPASPEARAFFPAAFTFSFMFLMFHGGPQRTPTYAWMTTHTLTFLLGPLAILRWATLTPDEVAPRTRAMPRWAFLFSAMGLTSLSYLVGWPFSHEVGARGQFVLAAALALAAVGILARNYRRSSPVGRRKIKWIVFGANVAGLWVLLGTLAGIVDPRIWVRAEVLWGGVALLPLFVWIAVARYNAFDIDRVISATASYALVIGAMLAGLLAGVPLLAKALGEAVGASVPVMQALAGVLFAACVVPAHRAIHPRLERLLFAEHYQLEQGMEKLLHQVAECGSPSELFALIGEQLDALFDPESCVVYQRNGGVYSASFVSGNLAIPRFAGDGALVAALKARPGILSTERGGRRTSRHLGAFDRAALEELGAEVVLQIRNEHELAAFVALGPKRSRDVYTPTDSTLLTALVQTAGSELKRFEAVEAVEQERQREARMRRYLPGAVAEQVASGRELAPQAREVSVLFVDIRGYATLCEGRPPEEIFEAVSRYTEIASGVVRRHGGTVVEFNGDGMMAVFGAPEPIEQKERAAVEAARDILEAVGGISFGADGGGDRLAVGIGIATGEAYVGSVRSADQLIWTALGNATNLAARLQALSRDLDAAIVIDAATRRDARYVAADFARREGVAIRGRVQTEEIWLLPLEPPG